MEVKIPELALVVLVGPSGSGKSTLARMLFKPTEVISSDFCRGLVSDDENNQAATNDAFEVLHFIARKRLAGGRLTVVDATNVQPDSRKPLVALAREFHVLPIAIVLLGIDVGEAILRESALSYLGLGIQPPDASWGNMLSSAQSFFTRAPWLVYAPGAVIATTVWCLFTLGDGLRDALDPRHMR